MTSCASEGGICTLPTGVTAVVYYGANSWYNARSGLTGLIGCNNTTFGDPVVGVGKACGYFVTSGSSGSSGASSGSVGPFIPHHFDAAVAPTCSSFTYAGQPFSATITAHNAANNTTVNYDGSSATSPNFAKAVTLADAPALGVGSFGATCALAATLFSAGVASSSAPTYTFTSRLTAAQSLRVRATDADAVSSSGFTEGSTVLRSGRLRLSNAFGSEKAALAVPVQAQYWSGNTWVANSADSCTTVPAAAVVRAATLDNKGAATSAWVSSASAIVISAGAGTLTLAAPSPTSTGSLDFALDLGAAPAPTSPAWPRTRPARPAPCHGCARRTARAPAAGRPTRQRAPPSASTRPKRARPSMRARSSERGFTLPELIAVIMLVSILAAVALPKMTGALSFRDDSWREQIVAALHSAHKSAVAHRRLVCATINAGSVTLSMASANPATSCNTALAGVDGSASVAAGNGAAATASVSPAGVLYFQPSGRVSTDGAGSNVAVRTITLAGQTSIVRVGETGHVD